MIARRYKYTLLLASLPRHATGLFSTSQTPLSRIQLDKRLTLLDAGDTEDLQRIEALLHWAQLKDETDQIVVRKSHEMIDLIRDELLKSMVLWRLELRTLLSALRQRHSGASAPEKNTFAGFGEWPSFIEKNWHENDFGVGHRQSWVVQAQELLAQNKSYELEKLLLDLVWQYYIRIGSQHYFDFPAVVIYVLRWDMINRWTHYNRDKAMERFDELVDSRLENFILDY